MRTDILPLGVLLCAIASWAADQAFDIKRGQWDVVNIVQMSGVKMDSTARTNTVKSCITREGIEQAIAKANSTQTNTCASKLVSTSASKVQLHIDCTEERSDMKSNGDITIERRDSDHFTGAGAMKMTDANGRTMNTKWYITGTFVSSDCGKVKPAGQ